MTIIRCPYCSKKANLVTGDVIYGDSNYKAINRYYYRCPDDKCDAHVSAHSVTMEPNGPLANRALRSLRMQVHKTFDPIWSSGHMTRTKAYIWLAKKMNMPRVDCHIAKFDADLCHKAKVICVGLKFKLRL